jgi:hypothetical protein
VVGEHYDSRAEGPPSGARSNVFEIFATCADTEGDSRWLPLMRAARMPIPRRRVWSYGARAGESALRTTHGTTAAQRGCFFLSFGCWTVPPYRAKGSAAYRDALNDTALHRTRGSSEGLSSTNGNPQPGLQGRHEDPG